MDKPEEKELVDKLIEFLNGKSGRNLKRTEVWRIMQKAMEKEGHYKGCSRGKPGSKNFHLTLTDEWGI